MDGKSVLEYLFGRLKAERTVTQEVSGQPYAVKVDGTLGEPIRELAPQWIAPTLQVSSLSGLVAAYKAKIDDFPAEVALAIRDVKTVELVALKADKFGHRHVWVKAAHADETPFRFNFFSVPEEFLIAFRASFYFNEWAEKVQRLASTVTAENSVAVADDGVSQVITVKEGAVSRGTVELPAEGIPLIPWRTFREAAPVESKFLLRMKGIKDAPPLIALFEIDAKWKLDTVASIQRYLDKELPGVTIIS